MSVVNFWSGRPTDTSARVNAHVTGASTRLAVADNVGMSGPAFYGPVAPSAQGYVNLDATGLAADTQYWYQIEDDGVLDTTYLGKLHTHKPVGEPYSYVVAVGSCAGAGTSYPAGSGLAPDRVSNHPVFDAIRALNPLMFIDDGDLAYYDFGSGVHVPDASLATYRDMYDTVLGTSRQGRLFREVASAYVWDDHCYAYNNSDGSFVDKANAAQVYRERVPSYPLAEPSGSIYHDFQIGRVHYVMLDSRYNRQPPTDPAPRTYLGSAQLAWLENILATSTATGMVIVSPQPIHSGGTTSWGSYSEERQDIYTMLADYLSPKMRVCMVSGDQHQLAIDTGTNTAGFPVYTLGPLDSTPNISGTYDLGQRAQRGQYGTLTIDDDGSQLTINGKGRYV